MSGLKLVQLNASSKTKDEKSEKVKVMKIEKPLGIIVRIDSTAEEFLLEKKFDIDNIDWKPIKSIIKTKGKGEIDRECDWEMPDGLTISMFGWTKGKEENINKLEVPPPVDMELFYGDLIFIATLNGLPIHFNIEKFEEFYSEAFGGFEDIEDSDSEPNDEYDEGDDCEGDDCDSFIVEDHDSEPNISDSESEAGETETEDELSEDELSEDEHSESFEYRSLTEEELESEEVKKIQEIIDKITEEQIIENCLGSLYVGFANEDLCILSKTSEEERWGEEIEINGNKVVMVPCDEE